MQDKPGFFDARHHHGGNDTDHNTTNTPAPTTTPTNTTQPAGPRNVGGIIAGSTVGGIFFIMLVALTVFVIYKRHRYLARQGRALGHHLLPDYVDPAHEEIGGDALFSSGRESRSGAESTTINMASIEEGHGDRKKSGYQPLK